MKKVMCETILNIIISIITGVISGLFSGWVITAYYNKIARVKEAKKYVGDMVRYLIAIKYAMIEYKNTKSDDMLKKLIAYEYKLDIIDFNEHKKYLDLDAKNIAEDIYKLFFVLTKIIHDNKLEQLNYEKCFNDIEKISDALLKYMIK